MDKRNLDLGVSVTADEWNMLARTAQDITPEDGLYWRPEERDVIEVYMRAQHAPSSWRDWITSDGRYGAHPLRVASFVWNDGDPFARNELEVLPESPNVQPQDVEQMQSELEHWVRNRWRELWEASGITYTERLT
jgi:hypothetical protein